MATDTPRMSAERKAEIREWVETIREQPTSQDQIDLIEVLDELAAVERERDEARTVTEDMVEKIARGMIPHSVWDDAGELERKCYLHRAREALTAALAPHKEV